MPRRTPSTRCFSLAWRRKRPRPFGDFIEENDTGYYLYLTPSTKRYYPFGALASQVLGFVNTEGGVYAPGSGL